MPNGNFHFYDVDRFLPELMPYNGVVVSATADSPCGELEAVLPASPAAAEDSAKQAASDLPAELAARSAHRALGH